MCKSGEFSERLARVHEVAATDAPDAELPPLPSPFPPPPLPISRLSVAVQFSEMRWVSVLRGSLPRHCDTTSARARLTSGRRLAAWRRVWSRVITQPRARAASPRV